MRRITFAHFVLILVLWATVAPAFAQTIWIDGTGDWFNAANWSAGVPNSNAAHINNGGTAQVTLAGATAGSVTLGSGAPDSGTLAVSGAGRLNDGGIMFVGDNGTGTLGITNGGVVMSQRFIIGTAAGSNGIATVSGAGSTWTNTILCTVGASGNGTLNITNGGQVSGSDAGIGGSNGAIGVVTVDGPGSTWTHPGTLTIAGSGAGTLTVTNGGSVFTGGSGGTFGRTIGTNPGSNGIATISGAGSAWTNNGPLAIADGFAGTNGALHVANGGAVSNSYSLVGGFDGSSGTATVDGVGSTWTNNGDLFLPGHNGGTGVLTITQGGVVSSSDGFLGIGSAASNGTVEVDGAGSTWTNSGSLYVGGTESGPAGVGLLRVENGGTVSANTTTVWASGTLEIGPNPTLNGALTFSGGTLRPIANTTFSRNTSLASGGVMVNSNGFIQL